MIQNKLPSLLLLAVIFILFYCRVDAEEGMWSFDALPSDQIAKTYGFRPTEEWSKAVRLACVRLEDGGSGSFISPHGLIITNHHVALKQIQKLSTPERDYVQNGFCAYKQSEEKKCPDLEINVLESMENVTQKVVPEGLKGAEYIKKLNSNISKIEKESVEKTGLKSNVVSLFNGGEYWLYRYKVYRDLRLVAAPPRAAASFGGDWDNFTYPRYDLDFAILRVYENDRPIESPYYFKINPKGAQENELIFVAGNPGKTLRGITVAELKFYKSHFYPNELKKLSKYRDAVKKFRKRGAKEAQVSNAVSASFNNSYKVRAGEAKALLDPKIIENAQSNESALLAKSDAQLKGSIDRIAAAVKLNGSRYNKLYYKPLNGTITPSLLRLPTIASKLVQSGIEREKPESERNPEYNEARKDKLLFELLSPEPIDKELEEALLTVSLQLTEENLKKEYTALFQDQSPEQVAKKLISETKLDQVAYRKQLYDGGLKALRESKDPLIQLYLKLAPERKADLEWIRKNVDGVIRPEREKIAAAKFKMYGKANYPDATFTLRLTYGRVRGYEYNGTIAPAHTTLYGVLDRLYSFSGSQHNEWNLPALYLARLKQCELSTPLNFVYEADTIGGNSGSPVFNKNLEFVGINFDRNCEGMIRQFAYSPKYARSIAVHAGAIMEILNRGYNAEDLCKEIYDAKGINVK